MKKLIVSVLLLTMGVGMQSFIQSTDKDVIGTTLLNLLDQWDADAFNNIVDVLGQVAEYNSEELLDWLLEAYSSAVIPIVDADGSPTDAMMLQIALGTFSGHFAVENGRWVKKEAADDMQFSFNDKKGNLCVARIAFSGTKKTVSYIDLNLEEEDEDDYDDDDKNASLLSILSAVTRVQVEVPEHVEFIVTQGSKQLVNFKVDVDQSLLADNWSPMTNGFIMSTNATFAKSKGTGSYSWAMDRVGYQPGTGISFNFVAKNEGQQLISFNFNAPGTLQPLVLARQAMTMPMASARLLPEALREDVQKARARRAAKARKASVDIGLTSIKASIDILGSIQGEGSISNLSEFIENYDVVSSGYDTEETTAAVAALSKQLNTNFYYGGGSDSKGSIILQPSYDEEWGEWNLTPAITFTSDGSTYPIKEYFDEENFPEVVNSFNNIYGQMGELVQKANGKTNGVKVLKGLKTGQRVYVYNAGGRLCQQTTVGADGRANLQLSKLPAGIYVIKTPTSSKKIMKR